MVSGNDDNFGADDNTCAADEATVITVGTLVEVFEDDARVADPAVVMATCGGTEENDVTVAFDGTVVVVSGADNNVGATSAEVTTTTVGIMVEVTVEEDKDVADSVVTATIGTSVVVATIARVAEAAVVASEDETSDTSNGIMGDAAGVIGASFATLFTISKEGERGNTV